jgi:type IV secretory pathway TraG/TraD family ATPase VirD4
MKRMSSLIESAAMQRASGNPLVLGYQNSAQIELLYGRAGMKALLGMAFTQVSFASTDPEIQKHIEEQCGYAEIERVSENMPAHVIAGNKHSRSSSLSSQQIAHDPVMMATEIGQLPPYCFVIKQRDMVCTAKILPVERALQHLYRRRLIPDLVLPSPVEAEDEEGIPVDEEEDPVPVDEVQPKRGRRKADAKTDSKTRNLFETGTEAE